MTGLIFNPRLKQNASGVWQVHWSYHKRSMRKSLRTHDQAKANERFAEWLRQHNSEIKGHTPTVRDCLAKYWREYAKTDVADPDRIKSSLKALLPAMGSMDVHLVTSEDIKRFIYDRQYTRNYNVKPSTIARDLSCLRAAFNHCVRGKYISADVVPHITLPKVPRKTAFWLSEDQVKEVKKQIAIEAEASPGGYPQPLHLFILLGLATASRKSAIEGLRWDQVDFKDKIIRYDLQVEFETRKRKVAVPMADWICEPLQEAKRMAGSPYVLGEDFSVRHRFGSFKKRISQRTGDKSFLDMTPHSLRHTAATHMLRNGSSLWQVAGMLGDSVETVADIYGHHVKDHLREAANSWGV